MTSLYKFYAFTFLCINFIEWRHAKWHPSLVCVIILLNQFNIRIYLDLNGFLEELYFLNKNLNSFGNKFAKRKLLVFPCFPCSNKENKGKQEVWRPPPLHSTKRENFRVRALNKRSRTRARMCRIYSCCRMNSGCGGSSPKWEHPYELSIWSALKYFFCPE